MDEMDRRIHTQRLLEVLGRDDGVQRQPQERPTNAEHLYVRGDQTLSRILEEIAADVAARDALIPAYIKADEKAKRASSESMRIWNEIRQLDDRAAKTREAFHVLRTRGR